MAANLDAIQTIVVLMMENRSFDHVLGYLSMPKYAGNYPSAGQIDGLRDDVGWLHSVANEWQGNKYFPIPLAEPRIPDPPHERPISRRSWPLRLTASFRSPDSSQAQPPPAT